MLTVEQILASMRLRESLGLHPIDRRDDGANATSTRRTKKEKTMSMLLNLIAESHSNSRSKGWWDDYLMPPDDSLDEELLRQALPEKAVLIHSEISEALEDYRVGKMKTVLREGNGKPEGYWSELADVCIRIFDLIGALEASAEFVDYLEDSDLSVPGPDDEFVGVLWRLHVMTSESVNMVGGEPLADIASLAAVVFQINAHAAAHDVDMIEEIKLKQAYNRTRSFRHGGKRI